MRPPPLQLLPAFEAAARLMSFSKAAAELYVTTAAISQQIKRLEETLGVQLFRRLTRQVELTEEGQRFAIVVTQTLLTYREGFANLLSQYPKPVVRLSMSPFVAYELFLPRLAGFQAACPNVDLRLEATMELADFDINGIDAAIRFGSGHWPDLECLPLCDCQASIVASLDLARRLPVGSMDDLKHHVLIHPRRSHMDWDAIAKLLKMPAIKRKGDLVLDSDLAALKAAEHGLGVAFCIYPAVEGWHRSDKAVALMPPIPLDLKAYFVFRRGGAKQALLKNVYDWIKGNVLQPER